MKYKPENDAKYAKVRVQVDRHVSWCFCLFELIYFFIEHQKLNTWVEG